MKSILRHSVLILLILSVLLGSVGTAFSEQLCLRPTIKSGMSTTKADTCCNSKKQTGKTEDNCCIVRVSYLKLDVVSLGSLFKLQAPLYFSHNSFPAFLQKRIAPAAQQAYTYTDSSPPVYGRELLHRLHILIV